MKIKPENKIQQEAFRWFNNEYCLTTNNPSLIIHSIPNGITVPCKLSDKIKALDIMNKMGQQSGVSDLMIHGVNGRCVWAECKADTDQSTDQIKMEMKVKKLGGIYFIFRSLEQFQTEIQKHLVYLTTA